MKGSMATPCLIEVFPSFAPYKIQAKSWKEGASDMTENASEKNSTATVTLEEPATNLTVRRETVTSELYVFDRTGVLLEIQDDGTFVLDIDETTGIVSGTHTHPAPHDVHGTFDSATRAIVLRSVDGVRVHTGVEATFDAKRYIGLKLLLQARAFFEQEEGVWVGTKVG